MSKTNAIDPNVPAGSEDPKLGDNRIRDLAAGAWETLAVDHYMGTDGGAGTGYNEDAAGEHAKVTLRETTKPTNAAGKGFIYAKIVSGVVELCYEDQAGNEIQITANGILNSCNLTGNQTVAGVKTFSSQPSLPEGLTAAKALVSTLAEGTAPLTVTSGTKVTNLNSDKVDGFDVAAAATGESDTIAGGYILKQGRAVYSGSDLTVTFGTPFPNECKRVVACIQDTAWTLNYACRIIGTPTVNSFVVSVGNATNLSIDWIAIGR